MTQPSRQPTIAEAVEIMLSAKTDQQRRANLVYWQKYGEAFVKMVAEQYERKGKK